MHPLHRSTTIVLIADNLYPGAGTYQVYLPALGVYSQPFYLGALLDRLAACLAGPGCCCCTANPAAGVSVRAWQRLRPRLPPSLAA